MAREVWTNEQLDQLQEQMVDGFTRVETDIRELRRMVICGGFIALIAVMVMGFLSLAGLIVP